MAGLRSQMGISTAQKGATCEDFAAAVHERYLRKRLSRQVALELPRIGKESRTFTWPTEQAMFSALEDSTHCGRGRGRGEAGRRAPHGLKMFRGVKPETSAPEDQPQFYMS